MDLVLEKRAGDAAIQTRVLAIHGLLILTIIASQIIYTPAHDPSADATWHFRLALDILSGREIFWSGVDANRFFPDLIMAMIGILMPSGRIYTTWLYYFYSIQLIAFYAAVYALATTFYDDARRRTAFCVMAVSALLLLTTMSPFWCGWFLEPGSHGTSLSACISLLALALWMNKAESLNAWAATVFVFVAASLIASNRYLLVGFIAPLFTSLLITMLFWSGRRPNTSQRQAGARLSGRGALSALIACTCVAALGGYLAWQYMDTMNWYRLTGGGSWPDFPTSLSGYGHWLHQRVERELSEVQRPDGEIEQVRFGIALLLLTVPATVLLTWRRSVRPWSSFAENWLIYGMFTTLAAVSALAFVVFITVESGPYHYRYLTIPVGFALVFLSSPLVGWAIRLGRWQGLATGTVLVSIVAVAVVRADERKGTIASNQLLDHGVRELERALRKRFPVKPVRGFADYWIAHDVTVRSDLIHLSSMQVHKALFTLYNSNAAELCDPGFSFIIYDTLRGEPKREVIVAALGEPRDSEMVNVGRYPRVEVMYYDLDWIQAQVIEPSKEEARRLFPMFRCRSN